MSEGGPGLEKTGHCSPFDAESLPNEWSVINDEVSNVTPPPKRDNVFSSRADVSLA